MIGDIFSFTEASYFQTAIAFDLVAKYLKNDLDFLPWSVFISRVKFYTDLFESTSSSSLLQTFLRDLVHPYYMKLGWIEDELTDGWPDQ